MLRETRKTWMRLTASVIIWLLLVGLFGALWMNYYQFASLQPFWNKGNWLLIAVYGGLLLLLAQFYGGFKVGHLRRGDLIFSGILATLLTNAITYLQLCLIARAMLPLWPIAAMSGLDMVLLWMWASVSSKIYHKLFPPYQMLLVYGGSDEARRLVKKMTGRSEKYSIQTVVNIEEGMHAVVERIDRHEAVILCDVPARVRNRLLKYCFSQGKRTYLTPKLSDILIRSANEIKLFDTPLLLNRNIGPSPEQRVLKRIMDLILSGIALVVFAVPMVLVALAVKLQDGGPVLYRQERLTQDEKHFFVYKFRSMVVDAESETGARLAAEGDDRITPVGRFIRRLRLDELPQLLNVFKGEMSLVGPRPERPELAIKYRQSMPEFDYRLKMKAGLTGYAQVVGRYNTTPYDKLKLDLMYISNYSLLSDFKLILMTIKILFQRESTQGLEE